MIFSADLIETLRRVAEVESTPPPGRPPSGPFPLPYVYRWDRHGRKGQPCAVVARGTLNSCTVMFADRFMMVTSRNALKRRAP